MKINRTLKNFEVIRTRIVTSRFVHTSKVYAKSAAEVKDSLENEEIKNGYWGNGMGDEGTVLNFEEEINIEEIK